MIAATVTEYPASQEGYKEQPEYGRVKFLYKTWDNSAENSGVVWHEIETEECSAEVFMHNKGGEDEDGEAEPWYFFEPAKSAE